MRQYLLMAIAALVAVIMGLFTIPYQGTDYRGQVTGYRGQGTEGANLCVPQTDNNVANPVETCHGASLQQLANTVDSTIYFPSTKVSQTAPDPYFAPAPLPMLPPEAMTAMSPSQLPPLDAGMVNVTGDVAGYRVARWQGASLQTDETATTPAETHGLASLQLRDGFALALPYDPSLLPQGFTEEDIQTYYYDRHYQRWVAIERDSVDGEELMVYSRFMRQSFEETHGHASLQMSDIQNDMSDGGGDSPLDFINAVLKTPEMPETSAYTPTSIKELKAADPLEGMTLIQPPTANNNGTANLSYPIETPAGRQGMQPNLALTYSSGGGNGWLGVGWDIPIPSITVETRWGVPRYDSELESEVYVYEGEQLVSRDDNGDFRKLPHRTNQWTPRHELDDDDYEQFYPRKNEAFDSIVRHGSGPGNYWWSVTHKNGVTDYYGKKHESEEVDNNSVLSDPKNENIARWMLTESVDPFGNWVRYYYKKQQQQTVEGYSPNEGVQIYIESIVYTGYGTEDGKYSVVFNREDGRKDIITNGRYGFREVTASTLCNVEVLFKEDIIRRYYFVTENKRESGYKTRLTDLVRMDSPIQDVDCKDILHPSNWDDNNGNPDIEGSFDKHRVVRYNFAYYNYPEADSLFSDTVEIKMLENDQIRSSFDNGIHTATALGATSSKDWSVGGTVCVGLGFNVLNSSDAVGGNFSYSRSRSKGLLTLIDLDGDGYADKVYKKGGIVYYRKNIADDKYHFHYGDEIELQGVSDFLDVVGNIPSFGVQGHCGVFNVNGSLPVTVSDTKVYFSDVNGDGLPDIVTDNGVLFNNTDHNGNVHFASFHTLSQPNPDDPGDYSYIATSSFGECDGGIIYNGAVNEEISCDIDYGYVTIPVEEGNLVNMLQTLQRYGYTISDYTDSTITYLPSDTTHHVVTCATGGNEPDLDAVRVWVAPYTGAVYLTSTTSLVREETETFRQSRHRNGVVFSIQHNGNIDTNNYALVSDPPFVLFRDTILQDDGSTHSFDTLIQVNANDILFFRLQSRGSRTADKVDTRQHIIYQSLPYGGWQYDSDDDFVLTGNSYFQAPKKGRVTISGDVIRRRTSPGSVCLLRIERNNTEMYSTAVNTNASSIPVNCSFDVSAHDDVKIIIQASNLDMDWGSVSFCPLLKFKDDTTDTSLFMGDTVFCYPPVIMNITDYIYHPTWEYLRYWFGELYKGWGQFAYNNNFPNSADLPIDVTRLVIPKVITGDTTDFNQSTLSSTINDSRYSIDTVNSNPSANPTPESLASDIDGLYNPLSDNTSWVSMIPYGEHGAYMGFGNTTAIKSRQMHNTRQTVIIPLEDDENENDYDEYGNLVEEIPEYDDVIPRSGNGSMAKTIRKRSVSAMGNIGAGVSVGPNLSVSLSGGENEVQSDFIDLNGDRYPDIVVKNSAQYTMPWGGLNNNMVTVGSKNHVCNSNIHSFGMTVGGGYPDPYREEGNNPPENKIAFRGASLSGSYVAGGDYTDLQFMDINGDGLPDRVTTNGLVALNTGYGFQDPEYWDIPILREGTSNSLSASGGISFSYNQFSIGGGIGKSGSESHSGSILMDFNGDGLPDMVQMAGSGIKVKYNYGNGEWSPGYENIPHIYGISQSSTYSTSSSIDLTVGFVGLAVKMTAGVQVSPSDKNFTRDEMQLTDVNGDGYPDFVTSDGETQMTIRYNKAGKTNLLKTVTNFTGSTVTLDYDMPMSCYEKPQRSWNLSSVEVVDPVSPIGGNRTLTTFEYGKPYHNRYERMDYGYDTVVTKEYDTDHGDTLYRYTVEVYENRNFAKRGRKTYDCLCNAAGNKYVEHLYDAVIYHWNNSLSEDSGLCANADLYIRDEYIETNYYEGLPLPQITKLEQRTYDNKRNLTQYIHYGNSSNTLEYFTVDIQYATGMDHNMVSLPVQMEVRDYNETLLRKRTATYTPKGRLLSLTGHNIPYNSRHDFSYDQYGNIDTVLFPSDDNGQRLKYSYQYDTIVQTYPIKVTNMSLGYYSTAEYDYWFGKPTKTVDVNHNEIRYTYDCIGRLSTVVAPNEIDSLLTDPEFFTIRYNYKAHHYGVLNIFGYDPNNPLFSYSVTEHYDPQHPDTNLRTTVVSDNLGRKLQTKRDAEHNGQKVMVVSGKETYDCFGRLTRQYHPFVDTGFSASYNPFFPPGTETTFEYDLLNRRTRTKLPTQDTTVMIYDFDSYGGTNYFRTTIYDAMGTKFSTLTGTLGQRVSHIAPSNAETKFMYDAIGQLEKSTDPEHYSTTYKYDLLGQLTHRNHPDAGDDYYEYDPAGNLTRHINGMGDIIEYRYNYNRLTDIEYPRYPANNVHYQYGTLNVANLAVNAVGKVVLQEDASGWQQFEYGKMGEITKNMRTFALLYEDTSYTFAMEFEYDSWNRIQRMTYPDGEEVSYGYDLGGMLKKVTGRKNNASYKYIDSIKYDKFNMRESVYYGNGTRTHYSYDIIQRLDSLVSYTSPALPGGGEPMQAVKYSYDGVGNITAVNNSAPQLGNGMGGLYSDEYVYDELYRLVAAEGAWQGVMNRSYMQTADYSSNGRLKEKNLTSGTLLNGTPANVAYMRRYQYDPSGQPNALVRITGRENHEFTWDATGNMLYHAQGNNNERYLCWDESNRLQGMKDNSGLSFYQYDANGERSYKLTGRYTLQNRNGEWRSYYYMDSPTLYASPYLVANRQGYTKHYYVEGERIASRIGGGGLEEIDRPIVTETQVSWKLYRNYRHLNSVSDCLRRPQTRVHNSLEGLYSYMSIMSAEPDCYWYHPDHLGSSSWITYSDGSAVQHLHYLPWGEDFIDQRSTNWNAMYTFSAKEKDTETGLSYFGARYYSSDLSIWLIVDPVSDKYPSLSPYTYCSNNPIKLVDPNGEEIVITGSDGNHTYTPGSICNSKDKNVQAAWNTLDKIYGTEAGKDVIGEMTKENSPTFTFTNESLMNDETGRFQKDGKGGGTMYMGGNLNSSDYLAHELFHGYQEMKGQGGLSIHNEVEANLFSMLTVGGGFVLGHKNDPYFKSSYAQAVKMFRIGQVDNFDKQFNVLVNGFKNCSIANIPVAGEKQGIYQNFNLGKGVPSLIKQYYQ